MTLDTAAPIGLEDVDPAILGQQRDRMIARSRVNARINGRILCEAAACSRPHDVPRLLSGFEKLLRLCMCQRGMPRFLLCNMAGNAVAFAMKKVRIDLDRNPDDIDAFTDRYINRDDLHLDQVMDDFRTWHLLSRSFEEDVADERGDDPPFAPRYDHLLVAEPGDPAAAEVIATAREVDRFRSVAFMTSQVQRRVRACVLKPGLSRDEILDKVRDLRKRLVHVVARSQEGVDYPEISSPVLAGIAYYNTLRNDSPRPPVHDFLSSFSLEDPRPYLNALPPKLRHVVLSDVERHFGIDPATHKPRVNASRHAALDHARLEPSDLLEYRFQDEASAA
jgi:hypothetical protein